MNTKKEEKKEEKKESPVEKPISLHGAPFKDVVKALLDTEPMPKEENKESEKDKG